MGKEETIEFKVCPMSTDFVKLVYENYEKYALAYSKKLGEVVQLSKDDKESLFGKESGEYFVKITSGKNKPVYRKLRAFHINKGEMMLGYRTMNELGVKKGNKITISKVNILTYYWKNSDSSIKYPFRIALVGLILAALFAVLSYCPFIGDCVKLVIVLVLVIVGICLITIKRL